jgi:methyl-accepting chemotaxis protein
MKVINYRGIVQVSQVVQNNAATSEESAAASEELSSQANQLKDIVNSFKVKHTPSNEPNKSAPVKTPGMPHIRALPEQGYRLT